MNNWIKATITVLSIATLVVLFGVIFVYLLIQFPKVFGGILSILTVGAVLFLWIVEVKFRLDIKDLKKKNRGEK